MTPAAGKEVPFTFFKVSELTVDSAGKPNLENLPNPSVDGPVKCLGMGHSTFSSISAQVRWLRVQGCRGSPAYFKTPFELLHYQNFAMPLS